MFLRLLLLFTIVPLVELYFLFLVAGRIGALNTLILVIATGVIGASMARSQGLLILRRIQAELQRGRMPGRSMVEGVIILCSGLLLLTPGIFTDFLGFLGLIPFSRKWFCDYLESRFRHHIVARPGSMYYRMEDDDGFE